MHTLDKAILDAFKKFEGKELTTSEIVNFVFPEDARLFKTSGSDNILFIGGEKQVKSSIRYKKSLLHKRLLYHLNKLVKQGILKISGIEEFGEKIFALSEDYGDVIIEDNKKTIVIRNNLNPVTPIDGYEAQRIVKKLYSGNWINKLDSILVNAEKIQGINNLYEVLIDLFEEVTDCIAINNFEVLLQKKDDTPIDQVIKQIYVASEDYNKNITFILNGDNFYDPAKLKLFVKSCAELTNKNIQIVFDVTTEIINKNSDFFEYVVELFSQKKIKINIKNKSLYSAPVFFGSAGVYCFDEKEWKIYEKEFSNSTIGASCCSSTLIIDVQEFFNNYSTAHEFREFILKANKSLLIANIDKRKIAAHYFRAIHKLNKPNTREFFFFERNYIRFWNYNFKLFDEKSFLLDLFKTSREETEKFSFSEETIYKACGIPIKFKVAFSSAFRTSDLTMTQRTYKKVTVHDIKYFESPENVKYIKTREKLLKTFAGLDRVRFFRANVIKNSDVLNEFNYILQNFSLPFFTYDFAKIKGNTKLTSFFKQEKTSKKYSKRKK